MAELVTSEVRNSTFLSLLQSWLGTACLSPRCVVVTRAFRISISSRPVCRLSAVLCGGEEHTGDNRVQEELLHFGPKRGLNEK